MDLSKLDRHERPIAISSGVLVVAGIVTAGWYRLYALTWLAVLTAVGALLVVFQPQIAPGAPVPGWRNGLLVLLGTIAGVIMVLTLLTALNLVVAAFALPDAIFLVAVAAGVGLALFGWQAHQADAGSARIPSAAEANFPEPERTPDV